MNIIFGQQISFEYVNYKGTKSTRNVIPMSLRFGSTEYHTGNQWLLVAYDIDKQAKREFALKDIFIDSSVNKLEQLYWNPHEHNLTTQSNPIWIDTAKEISK